MIIQHLQPLQDCPVHMIPIIINFFSTYLYYLMLFYIFAFYILIYFKKKYKRDLVIFKALPIVY